MQHLHEEEGTETEATTSSDSSLLGRPGPTASYGYYIGSTRMNHAAKREEDTIAHEGDPHQAIGVKSPEQHAHIFHPPICPNSVFNPILHKPVIFNILLNRPHSFSTVYYTKDFGNLKLTYYILYRPDASKLDRIIKTLGEAYDDKFLPLIGNEGSEILKKILRDIDIQQLPMKCSRSNVSDYLLNSLKSHASEFDIIIKDVQIINVTYSYQLDRCVHESNDDDNKKD
ncbi:hypothetical protein AAC387_Pa08g1795 [Persea americana]